MNSKITLSIIFIFFIKLVSAQVDRSKAPEPGPAPDVNVTNFQSFQLENGLKVIVVENKNRPSVDFTLIIDRDPILEGDKSGYLEAAGDMIGRATTHKTKDEINEEFDFIGASFYKSSNWVYASALKKHLNTLTELLADVIKNSVFNQEELDKVKLQMKSGLQANENNPSYIASQVYGKVLYGDHPYGEIETQETIENFDLDDIKNYYNKYFIPNEAYLAITGNIDLAEAKTIANKYFSDWKKGEVEKLTYPEPKPNSTTQVAIVNRTDAVQSVLRVGHIVKLKPGTEDVIKASVANTILGGGVFRLFENLREKHSFTYGAYSSLSPDRLIGRFTASSDVRSEVTDSAVTQMIYEMNRIRNEKVPAEELQRAKNYMSGNFALGLENPQTVARYAINIDRYNMPKDYYANYLKNVAAVSADDVMAMAKKYIHPDQANIVVVGNASEIADKMKKFGPVTFYDVHGEKVKPPTAKVEEGMTAKKVIDAYIKACGGEKKLDKVKSLKMTYTGDMSGNPIQQTVSRMVPNYYKSVFSVMGMEQATIYNGDKGITKTPQGNMEMKPKELEKMKIESNYFYLAKLDELGIKAELKSIESIKGEDAYKIKLTAGESSWTEFFSKESGLRVAESSTEETPRGNITQTVYYQDYKDYDGIMLPSKLIVSVGPQTIPLELSDAKINPKLKKSDFNIN